MRQRLCNSEPKRKEALKISDKKFKEKQKHTLHSESIAIENPLYIPEVRLCGPQRVHLEPMELR